MAAFIRCASFLSFNHFSQRSLIKRSVLTGKYLVASYNYPIFHFTKFAYSNGAAAVPKVPVVELTGGIADTSQKPSIRLSGSSFQKLQTINSEDPDEAEFTEYFIPVTKSSIVRYLLEEPGFLNNSEKSKYEQFAAALDHVVHNKFSNTFDDLKRLFEPLNPDKRLLIGRQMILRDRLDKEFWLLQKLALVLERANFFEIPHHVIESISRPHRSRGLQISFDTERYAVLRLWALGQEVTYPPMPLYEELFRQVAGRWFPHLRLSPRRPRRYFRRLVAAVRLKSDSTLQLKAFRDVPIRNLEVLLPDGTLGMTRADKLVVGGAAAGTVVGATAQLVVWLADFPAVWPIVAAFFSSLVWGHRVNGFRKRSEAHLEEMNRTQFYKVVATNASLLTAVSERALAEIFKEALITYTFLLAQRSPSTHAKRSHQHTVQDLGGLPKPLLEKKIEAWVKRLFRVRVRFDAEESLHLLENLGLIAREEEVLRAQPLDQVVRSLPVPPRHLLDISEENDSLEGYDKDVLYDDILRDDRILSKHGWT